jgi:hypothetical protein
MELTTATFVLVVAVAATGLVGCGESTSVATDAGGADTASADTSGGDGSGADSDGGGVLGHGDPCDPSASKCGPGLTCCYPARPGPGVVPICRSPGELCNPP